MPSRFIPPTECPVCGEPVPRGAKACPGCGADERSGWNEDEARYDGLDLPEEAFADESNTRAASRKSPRSSGKLWLAVAVVLIGLFVLGIFFR